MTSIRTNLTLLILLVLVIATQPSLSSAATYYVSTTGDDAATGGGSAPWRTLQHAANAMLPGDEVLVTDGTYEGFYTTRGGSASRPIVFRANGSNVAVSTNNASTPDVINVEGHDYVELHGFEVYGGSRCGIRVVEARGVIIRECSVGPNQKWGIFAAFTPDIQIIDNVCFAAVEQHGIYLSNSRVADDNPVIRGNDCYGNGQNGIQLNGDCHAGGDGVIQGAVIECNRVHDNNWKGFSIISVSNSVIHNNLVFNNGVAGIGAGGIHLADEPGCGKPSSNNVVANNTVIELVIAAMRLNNDAAGNTVFNNLTVSRDVSRTIVDEDGGNAIDTASNLRLASTAGLFIDDKTGDFHLAPGSHAIDAGVSFYNHVKAPATDCEGARRPVGKAYDIGADEHAALRPVTQRVGRRSSRDASDEETFAAIYLALDGTHTATKDTPVAYQAVLSASNAADASTVLLAQTHEPLSQARAAAPDVTASGAVLADHPRLIPSAGDITRLRALACYDQNGNTIPNCTPTSEWTQYKNWVDDNTQYYKPKATDYIQVYLVTQNQSYADQAISYANGVIADMSGERSDSFLYVYRSATDAAMVYDVFYDQLSPGQRTSYINYMNQLVTEIWNPSNNPYFTWTGWGTQQPGNNYYYSFMMSTAYIALALYGENPTQLSLPFDGTNYTDVYDFMWAKFSGQMIPYLNSYGKGGGWHEGTNYRIGSYIHMFDMFLALRDAGDTDLFTALDFPKESLYWQLYILQPGNGVLYPGGDLARESSMAVSAFDREIMLLIAEGLKGTLESQYAQHWLNTVFTSVPGGWQFEYGPEFMLNQGLASRNYDELPLGYMAEGLGFVNSRSSWQSDAVSVSFISTDLIESHQHKDQNSFVIFRDDWQAIDAVTYSHTGIIQETDTHNTILVDGYGQRSGRDLGSLTKYELTDDYSYVVGDAADAYYAGIPSQGAAKLLSHFERELVHAFPNVVVVCDRITPINTTSTITYLLHTRFQPTVQGNLVTSSQDNGKLFHRTLTPAVNFNTVSESYGTNGVQSSYRVEIEPASPSANHVWVSVMYVGSAATSSMPATELVTTETNNMVGAKIDVGGEDAVFMFSTDPGGAAPQSVIYQVGFARTEHNLMDLKPSTEYRVSTALNGGAVAIVVAEGPGQMTSGQGVLRFVTGSESAIAANGGGLRSDRQ